MTATNGYFLGFGMALLARDSYKRPVQAANGRLAGAASGFGAAPFVLTFAASFVVRPPFLFTAARRGEKARGHVPHRLGGRRCSWKSQNQIPLLPPSGVC